jgi:hypothetical protein
MKRTMQLQELKPDTPWLLEFLRMIRERPAMYLGNSKIYTLSQWLDGYVTARADLEIEPFVGDEVGLLDGFTHWLAVKLPTTISCRWAGIIHHEIDGSERNMETFFGLFDEYQEALKTTSLAELEESYEDLFRR